VQGKTPDAAWSEVNTIIGHPDVRRMLMDMKARPRPCARWPTSRPRQIDKAHGHADDPEQGAARRPSST
jgi:hypothetical protein